MPEFSARVLLVDDRSEDRRDICSTLAQAAKQQDISLHIWEAADAATAISRAQSSGCDLIIVDYDLGDGVTGVEVITAIKELHLTDAMFVLISGYDEKVLSRELIRSRLTAGTNCLFLNKPVRLPACVDILIKLRERNSRRGRPTSIGCRPNSSAGRRDKIFVSYSHNDRRLVEEFKIMLAPAIQKGLVDLWSDERIQPGEKWEQLISDAISGAGVAVLLVSPSFLASTFITQIELPALMRAAKQDELTIFWVCLTDCLFGQTDFDSYQAAHDVSQPLDKLSKPKRQTVFREICVKLLQTSSRQGMGPRHRA